jgi:hypothetical protein
MVARPGKFLGNFLVRLFGLLAALAWRLGAALFLCFLGVALFFEVASHVIEARLTESDRSR